MNSEMIGQPHEMAIGPPLFHAWPDVVKQPARMEMIENEMAKLENPDQERFNSCLYPSSASLRSSAESSDKSAMGAPGDGDKLADASAVRAERLDLKALEV